MKCRGRVSVLVVSVAVVLAGAAYARQDGWIRKSFSQWTKDDIIKISSDSPWAQVRQAEQGTNNYTPADYLPAVTIRLRSALPIRQALVRLKQIEAKYDKMDEKKRAEFDAKTEGTLRCPACADNYVVSVGPPVSQREVKSGIPSLKNAIFAQLEKRVYLANERGERRELVHFVAPKHDDDEATFFFSRFDANGNPLLTPEIKKLLFMFEAKNIRTGFSPGSLPERFEFDVSRMIVDGKVEF
jgi:hypothetical protein